ncbi:HEPN domain-containing protein [Neorhizobium sp. P12A]|uniref:nucleotidyltransferase and HEPN domain-containing protein n=1 Tax=Neorhizobium sp. P12A TaxID=2268027 RepID=UPI0011ECBCD1|nr:nucleotidyltransferase and HEPN domain-containing protein [Neorhizobium sp. P12A]KAA0692637.1 HEPN domain-containing protein [Neorhizobium sp. P12A]
MKSSLEHLPEQKQRELARVVEIIHEEFEDALKGSEAEFKKKGRIWKIILFGSYARGTWVEEPHTTKAYRSDYDILIIVNTKKLTDPEYWEAARSRLMHDSGINTPVGVIVQSRREVGDRLHLGQPFFSDIRRDGIVLYELNDDLLPQPKPMSPDEEYSTAKSYFEEKLPFSIAFMDGVELYLSKRQFKHAAFLLHQSIEQAYATLLLTLTGYSPASHNIRFLRALSEDRDVRLASAWPRSHQRFTAWFNLINEAYVKARYSPHYEISDEALIWLEERTAELHKLIKTACEEHLMKLRARL